MRLATLGLAVLACLGCGHRVCDLKAVPLRVLDLAGLWVSADGFESYRVEILSDGLLRVEYGDCVGAGASWTRGRLEKDELLVDHPRDMNTDRLDRLLYRSVAGKEYLVPASAREFFEEEVQQFEKRRPPGGFETGFGLERLAPKDELERNLLDCPQEDRQKDLFSRWARYRVRLPDVAFLKRLIERMQNDVRDGALEAMLDAAESGGGERFRHAGGLDCRNHLNEEQYRVREAARAEILRLLATHGDQTLRLRIAERLTDPNLLDTHAFAASSLKRAWKGDPDSRVRIQAAMALAVLEDPDVAPFLLEALGKGPSPELRRRILHAFSGQRLPQIVPIYEAEVAAGEFGWDHLFVWVLEQAESPGSVPALLEGLRKTREARHRAAIMTALGTAGVNSEGALKALVHELTAAPEREVIESAAKALACLAVKGDGRALEELRRLAGEKLELHRQEKVSGALQEVEAARK